MPAVHEIGYKYVFVQGFYEINLIQKCFGVKLPIDYTYAGARFYEIDNRLNLCFCGRLHKNDHNFILVPYFYNIEYKKYGIEGFSFKIYDIDSVT